MTVLSGPPVNIYFVDESGHAGFHGANATSFTYLSPGSTMGTVATFESWILQEPGIFWVIIENGYDTEGRGNATVDYRVRWDPNTTDSFWIWVFVVLLIIMITIFTMALTLWMTKRRSTLEEEDLPPPEEWGEEYTVTGPPPKKPEPYPEWVVEESQKGRPPP